VRELRDASRSHQTPSLLGEHAKKEADELGPVPIDPRERELWGEERRNAVELLASLANWDSALLRRAALEEASEWTNRGARDLLLEAAHIRG
jgi:hypothetical protein